MTVSAVSRAFFDLIGRRAPTLRSGDSDTLHFSVGYEMQFAYRFPRHSLGGSQLPPADVSRRYRFPLLALPANDIHEASEVYMAWAPAMPVVALHHDPCVRADGGLRVYVYMWQDFHGPALTFWDHLCQAYRQRLTPALTAANT